MASAPAPTRRSYGHYCGLARALDLLGERWTLLVVRELLTGPKRFRDLLDGLPGIAPNLLSTRLKALETEGVVRRRTLPPPAGSNVYELTEAGRELEDPVLALMRWGAVRLLHERREDDSYRASWLLNSLRVAFEPERAQGVEVTGELHVDGEVLTVEVSGGEIRVVAGEAIDPDVRAHLDVDTLLDIGRGDLTAADALARGELRVEGDPEAVLQLAGVLQGARAD